MVIDYLRYELARLISENCFSVEQDLVSMEVVYPVKFCQGFVNNGLKNIK